MGQRELGLERYVYSQEVPANTRSQEGARKDLSEKVADPSVLDFSPPEL